MPEDTQNTNEPEAPETPDADSVETPEDAGPQNTVAVEDAGTLKKKITITIPREKIDLKHNELFGELATSAQIPGFRVGRAPRRLIEKRFGKEIGDDVRNGLVGEALGDALEKADLKALGEPVLDLDAITLPDEGDMTFSFEVEVAPEFDLPELEGIPVEQPEIEIGDEQINEYLEQMRMMHAAYEDTEDAAADGDLIIGAAKISGEGIEPVEKHGLQLRVAAGQIEGIPLVDLGKTLAGKQAGETAAISTTVPEAHPNEAWRGKELAIEITVSQVRRRVLPELNDGFAARSGFETLDEMKQFLGRRLQDRHEQDTQRALGEQVCKYLLDNTEFELPEGVVARHTVRLLQRRYIDLMQRGVPKEQIDEHLTELKAAADEEANNDLRLSFILGRIAEQGEVEVSDAEINARIAQMAQTRNRRPERLRQELTQDGSLEAVEVSLKEEKVLAKLLAGAKVSEPAGDEKPEGKSGGAKAEKDTEDKPEKKAAGKTESEPAAKSEKKSAKKSSKKSTRKSDDK